jgi:hypothetical protein
MIDGYDLLSMAMVFLYSMESLPKKFKDNFDVSSNGAPWVGGDHTYEDDVTIGNEWEFPQ